ncbi:VOC family protein [Vineibacter terrae]|uniref:VOC family protein n=1 Tax=Vineibacter terrae TaxID=2586908 RepID=UPI002E31F411|nr:VOC family protein [Vineibacter terrae]HEX2891741.1 VOC family protein [Vineibacter terrae]
MVLEDAVARAAADRRKVAPTKLAHVVFRTAAKQPMLDWYSKVLDGEVVFDNAFIGFITYDDEHHRVAVIEVPDLQRPERIGPGLHHVAFTYGSLTDLLHTYERLKAEGIRPQYCINHGPTTSMYYGDPDGNRVELQIDNFPTMEEATAWLNSPAFAENPIGVDFDPEELLAKHRRGVPEAELKRRPNIGPRGLPAR